MIYIKFYGYADYVGTEYEEYQVLEDETTEDTLEKISEEINLKHTKSYEYLAAGLNNCNIEDEEERNYLIEHCINSVYGYEIISKEEYEREM